jgi:transcription factor CRZ1
VCTVCGRAFARQHDRKRHEGLHVGEKKFVCRGNLQGGEQWGCGRRFARVEALARHFRSEVGRVCIEPLHQEAILESQKSLADGGISAGAIHADNITRDFFPTALLQQYPALAGIDWSSVP